MKQAQIKLLSFGEVLWDIIDGQVYIGGAPFNLAAHASRCGLDAYLLSCVGADDLGRRARAEIARMNVHRQYVQTDHQHPTGTVTVGAGDAFSAAFLAGWLRGKTAIEAAALGNLLGAFVASRRGAIPDYDNEIRGLLGL